MRTTLQLNTNIIGGAILIFKVPYYYASGRSELAILKFWGILSHNIFKITITSMYVFKDYVHKQCHGKYSEKENTQLHA